MKKIFALFIVSALITIQACTQNNPADTAFINTEISAADKIITEPVNAEKIPELIIMPDLFVESIIENMSIEQKIGQMFILSARRDGSGVGITGINQNTRDLINNYNIGGFILFSENIATAEQTADYINDLQRESALPMFIAVDEEGGRVLRTEALDVPRAAAAMSIGDTGDAQNAYKSARTIAGYLLPLGFNVNFAPVADVFTNPQNTVIGDRAFSSEADTTARMVEHFTRGLLDGNILPAVKHFPGHGDTLEDSHFGAAVTYKTLEELLECELIPFKAGIKAGAPFVMVGHINAPNSGVDFTIPEPALFSPYLLQLILRGQLGFEGIIITDALDMGAVTKYYDSAETAVKAVLAGVDILLMPADFEQAYTGIIQAAESGVIPVERIDESVRRILTVKYNAGIIE
ncbi:MAG: glycoside hydrolase family 3 protein [Oscillospiraceae bacterium]|nr:glycoside hydrolase family 3 protein [Oscillospiraceae bacterium]